MAPLPLFHRPLSQDNSRETSLSSGRGRGSGPDTSGSGSGVSLPMRGQTGKTPDTPSTILTPGSSIPNAASSDYLIPLTGNIQKRPNSINMQQRRSIASHTTGTPVSSPSDEPASNSDSEDANLIQSRSNVKTIVYDNEAETSFTTTPMQTTTSSYSNVRANRQRRRASGAKLSSG